jgi:hypothetical protein
MAPNDRFLAQGALSVPDCGYLTHPGWSDVIAALEGETGSAYILAPDLSLLHVNTAWQTFARDNGAPWLAEGWHSFGPVVRGLPSPLQQFFETRLGRALSRNCAWSHTYECSSPDVYRRFHMRARAGPAGEALVVVHSLVIESRLASGGPGSLVGQFTDGRGLIVRCAACGRTKRPGQPYLWEWVPSLDAEANISTGICAICSVQEYGFELQDA